MQKFAIAIFGAVMLFVGGASAKDPAPLKAAEIERFIATLDAANALGKELDAQGKTDVFVERSKPKAGEAFKPYSRGVAVLKEEYPGDHARLDAVVQPHGFSADSWAATGDRVVIAYLAEMTAKENPDAMAQMAAMDPAMLDALPAEAKAQFATVFAMMETVNNAPEGDREAVRPFLAEIDAKMAAME